MSMHQLDCVKKIADDEGGGFLRKSCPVRNNVEQLTIGPKFKDDVEVLLIIEVAVDLDDVRMIQKALDFELPNKLSEKVVLEYTSFFNHFQSYCEATMQFPCQVYASELSFSQFFYELKVLSAQFSPVAELHLERRLGLTAQKGGKCLLGLVRAQPFV